jgi:branched-chain amino acid transport system substrate-binding protein
MVHQTRRLFLLLWICVVSTAHYTKADGHLQTSCGHRVNVALLVPLSGPQAELGEKLIETAQQALFENPSTTHLVIYPLDSHKKTTLAEEVLSLNPSLIIGPVFSEEAKTLQPLINDIPLFTLSNDQSLVDGSMFVMGFSPQEETRQLIHFSLQKNLTRFVALLPDNIYGRAIDRTLREILNKTPSMQLHIIFYPFKEHTPEMVEAWAQQIKDFHPEALFIPDGSAVSQKLLSTLQFMGDKTFRHIQVLGLSQWDQPGLLKNPSLKRLWFTRHGVTHLKNPLESIVYDIVRMTGDVQQRLRKSSFLKEDFLNPQGFKGTHGHFILKADGSANRTWRILEHTGPGAKVIG